MNYITATDLRTKTSQIIRDLKLGSSLSLIHRSRVIGIIKPIREPKPFDADSFKRAIKNLNLPSTTYAQREKIYHKHLMKKYGKGLPRRKYSN